MVYKESKPLNSSVEDTKRRAAGISAEPIDDYVPAPRSQ